ncbi:MAG TPA: MucR family transcriptional regulator [Phenylobacterium sp.]
MADETNLIGLTAEIIASYVEANRISPAELPGLIQSVHTALGNASAPAPAPEPEQRKVLPAEVRRSTRPDGLVSFEDGRTYKTLKRHLAARGLTPAQYREKWGLPTDYPMTAPAYAAQRSELAKAAGLGQAGGRQGKGRGGSK